MASSPSYPPRKALEHRSLSSRWRPLWCSAPLNLDTRGTDIFDGVISRIVSVHQGPARCFKFSHPILCYAVLDGWLRAPALNELQEVELSYTVSSEPQSQRMPRSTLRFSATLRVAKFSWCYIPYSATSQALFPNLQHLTLCKVRIEDGSLHAMITSCPFLKRLILMFSSGFRRLKISSLSLESVAMSFDVPDHRSTDIVLQELIVETAPCLERLLHNGHFQETMCICIISAPKVEDIGSHH